MGSPQIFNFWGERKQQSPNDASVIHCDLLAERESTAKTSCALRSQHLLSQMHSLSIIPAFHAGAFSKKALLLRFPFPCSYPIPLGLKTKEEPRNTQRTPNHLKVLFIKIGYLKEIFVTVCIGYLPPMPNTSVNFLYTPL